MFINPGLTFEILRYVENVTIIDRAVFEVIGDVFATSMLLSYQIVQMLFQNGKIVMLSNTNCAYLSLTDSLYG